MITQKHQVKKWYPASFNFFSTKEIEYSACKAVVLQVMVALIQYYLIFILFFEISQYEHYNLLYGLWRGRAFRFPVLIFPVGKVFKPKFKHVQLFQVNILCLRRR